MNKEDILKILEGAKDKNGDVPMRLVRQAFEKLPESCTDTISQQAAIDALDKRFDSIPMEQTTEILLLRRDLRNLPPVQPERKMGHWEIYVISMFDGEGCKCSECGSEGAPHWVSCPNCDARMEGEE